MAIPSIQSAVQVFEPGLVGLNSRKSVLSPGPYQVLVRVETVGLCFSDLKLLKQFDKHPRKSQIISGIGNEILKEIPSYKPDLQPTVPGHETLCTIITAGEKVTRHRVGQRVIIQADYRWLKTDGANAAFGYNFEGALQQYIIMDERIFVDLGKNESGLITVDEKLSDSAYALIEPWACVESSYITLERNAILAGGKMLIAVDADVRIENLKQCFAQGKPALITVHCQNGKQLKSLCNLRAAIVAVDDLELLTNEAFDDIIYFGSDAETIELLNDKIAAGGIINIVLGGKKIEREVSIGLGRVHYSRTRWIGTAGSDPRESYKIIPQTGEIRKADKIFIAGAAGPMGQMHTIRLLCSDVEDVSITAADIDDVRLGALRAKVKTDKPICIINSAKHPVTGKFSYFVILAPVGALIAQAINDSSEGALINLFAGIPASIRQEMDLNRYIENKCFIFGSSGSRISDMKIVLDKALAGKLNIDLCVDAVSGMAGAIDGISAVENRTMAGKIVVYPQMEKLPLIKLSDMKGKYPRVADKLNNGLWTKEAEQELLDSVS